MNGKLHTNVRDLDSYVLNDNILYKKRTFLGDKNCSPDSTILNIVAPSTLLKKAINYAHYRHHTGVKHTLFSFKLLYYHPNERSMVMTYVANCDVFKILKGRVDVPIEIQTAPTARKPFEAVAIVFLGPLITSRNRDKNFLTVEYCCRSIRWRICRSSQEMLDTRSTRKFLPPDGRRVTVWHSYIRIASTSCKRESAWKIFSWQPVYVWKWNCW